MILPRTFQFVIQNHCKPVIQVRTMIKDYDKIVKLLPEKIQYKYKDDRFLPGQTPQDTPFPKRTDDEIYDLQNIKFEWQYKHTSGTDIDATEEPFSSIYNDHQGDRFTGVTTVDPSRWVWVERLLPIKLALPIKGEPGQVKPSGFVVPHQVKPKLSYFVARTRSHLFPVYRNYILPKDATKDRAKGWLTNKWKWLYINDKYEKEFPDPLVVTLIKRVDGDIWKFEEDLRGDLEVKKQGRILSACNEIEGTLRLKGDYVLDVVEWLKEKGF